MTPPKDRYAALEKKYGDDFRIPDRLIEAIARDMCADPAIRAPVQGFPGGIPWEMHMRAYEAYSKKWSPQVALINLYGRGCRGGFGVNELDDFLPGWRDELSERTRLLARVGELEKALEKFERAVNVPEVNNFLVGAELESQHQRVRWPADHDAGKAPEDWLFLIGYLAGKACAAQRLGDLDKAKHHTISSAAALANWHLALAGIDQSMRPGIDSAKLEART